MSEKNTVNCTMEDNATFSPLSGKLENWIQNQLILLAQYADSFDITFEEDFTPVQLDQLWVLWKKSEVNDSDSTDSFLNCFGIGFGTLLIKKLGFEWALLEDEYGKDLAVRALPGTADTRIVPLHFVLKRWESKENEFIEHSLKEIEGFLNEQAEEHGIKL